MEDCHEGSYTPAALYIGWLGFWNKAAMVDTFILLDTVQFSQKQYQNRCQIAGKYSGQWITVPTKKHQDTLIKDVLIANEHRWAKPMLRTIQFAYQGSPYFDMLYPALEDMLVGFRWENLVDLNLFFIVECGMWLGITPKWIVASDLKSTGGGQQYLADLVKEVGGDQYVTGSTDKDYHEPEVFEKAGIEVIDQNFVHPEYTQKRPGFVPNLSVVDLFFNHGHDSKDIICGR